MKDVVAVKRDRIAYIDFIKGVLILWVIWYHTTHPDIIDTKVRIPTFLFLSGIFFKQDDWGAFFQKKRMQLIVPFLFFYVIGYFGSLLLTLIAPNTTLNIYMFTDLFTLSVKGYIPFQHANLALWFLFGLFYQQLIWQYLTRVFNPPLVLFSIAVMLSLLGEALIYFDIPTPLALGAALTSTVYYAAGALIGKRVIQFTEKESLKSFHLLIGFAAIYLIQQFVSEDIAWTKKVLPKIQTLLFIPCFFALSKRVYNMPGIKYFSFFGKNTLVVLGLHMLFLTFFIGVFKHLIPNTQNHLIMMGFIYAVLTSLVLIPSIHLMNRYFPMLIGKEEMRIPSWIKKQPRG